MKTGAKQSKKPAVFLDRDGTLMPDLGYVGDPKQVKLYKETVEALRLLRREGFYLFVVTNQSGVARGYFSESAVRAVNHRLQTLLKAKGARIDAFFYCPHYKEGTVKRYIKVCNCRKPKPGMVKQALRKYPVDLKHSYVVGDKVDDLQLARNAKVSKGFLVLTGNGHKSRKQLKAHPVAGSMIASNLLEAARGILKIEGLEGMQ